MIRRSVCEFLGHKWERREEQPLVSRLTAREHYRCSVCGGKDWFFPEERSGE